MAGRYGGPYSPDPQPDETATPRPRFRGRAPLRHAAKSNILFLLPLLAAVPAFFQPVAAMAVDLSGAACLLLSAWLTREGLRAEQEFDDREIARRPAIPRKIFGAAATAAGVGLLVWGGQWTPAPGVVVATLAGALHLGAFGLDPLRSKGLAGSDRQQTDRLARKIAEAERILDAMSEAAGRTRDREIAARVADFADTARQMFRRIERDPRDLVQARRYLGVYLEGARDATAQFADLAARRPEPKLRADYLALLDDLETNFAKRTTALLADDRVDFEIETEVLRERLQRDNVHLDR